MATLWYYAKSNQRHRPVSLADVRRLLTSGSLQPTDLVWADALGRTKATNVGAAVVLPQGTQG